MFAYAVAQPNILSRFPWLVAVLATKSFFSLSATVLRLLFKIAANTLDLRKKMRLLVALITGLTSLHVAADCFDDAGRHFGVSPDLLRGIDYVESRGRDHAVNRSHLTATSSYDIGRTQINSRWLPTLAKYGLSEGDLYDACTNIHVGAWILSDLMRRYGDTWNAVGAYNAACTKLKGDACAKQRARYAWDVYRAMQRHSK